MDTDFWHQKWKAREIGFHQTEANPLLIKWFKELALEQGNRVFLPLCGKTLDIAWLLSNGYRVAGAELSETAIEELFLDLGLEFEITIVGNLKHYVGQDIDIFVGDIFDLSASILGTVDAIYDRAALVALPEVMRRQYSSHLMQITNRAPQLVICLEYDQDLMAGPPFSISATEFSRHYRGVYQLSLLESVGVAGGLKGCAATENAWLLLEGQEI
ncbi:MAG: thiopurine S-methyltransferase [Thermoanaerobaculia bacterium]|nr:thiopurine S-methyltransferase [Thermoanaerobaculia bacterium]